jgi:hypothetical protein
VRQSNDQGKETEIEQALTAEVDLLTNSNDSRERDQERGTNRTRTQETLTSGQAGLNKENKAETSGIGQARLAAADERTSSKETQEKEGKENNRRWTNRI